MLCKNCGTENIDTANYCYNCGIPLHETNPSAQYRSREHYGKRWYYAVGEALRGPATANEMRELKEQGIISDETIVRRNDFSVGMLYKETELAGNGPVHLLVWQKTMIIAGIIIVIIACIMGYSIYRASLGEAIEHTTNMSQANTTENQLHVDLLAHYNNLDTYHYTVKDLAAQLDQNYDADIKIRKESYQSVEDTLDLLKKGRDALKKESISEDSPYYDACRNMLACYKDEISRVNAIADAWMIDFEYEDPENAKDIIFEPIQKNLEGDPPKDKYESSYLEHYEKIEL